MSEIDDSGGLDSTGTPSEPFELLLPPSHPLQRDPRLRKLLHRCPIPPSRVTSLMVEAATCSGYQSPAGNGGRFPADLLAAAVIYMGWLQGEILKGSTKT